MVPFQTSSVRGLGADARKPSRGPAIAVASQCTGTMSCVLSVDTLLVLCWCFLCSNAHSAAYNLFIRSYLHYIYIKILII